MPSTPAAQLTTHDLDRHHPPHTIIRTTARQTLKALKMLRLLKLSRQYDGSIVIYRALKVLPALSNAM